MPRRRRRTRPGYGEVNKATLPTETFSRVLRNDLTLHLWPLPFISATPQEFSNQELYSASSDPTDEKLCGLSKTLGADMWRKLVATLNSDQIRSPDHEWVGWQDDRGSCCLINTLATGTWLHQLHYRHKNVRDRLVLPLLRDGQYLLGFWSGIVQLLVEAICWRLLGYCRSASVQGLCFILRDVTALLPLLVPHWAMEYKHGQSPTEGKPLSTPTPAQICSRGREGHPLE